MWLYKIIHQQPINCSKWYLAHISIAFGDTLLSFTFAGVPKERISQRFFCRISYMFIIEHNILVAWF